jgi:hypothetical protein
MATPFAENTLQNSEGLLRAHPTPCGPNGKDRLHNTAHLSSIPLYETAPKIPPFFAGLATRRELLQELCDNVRIERAPGGGRPSWEQRHPQLAADIRAIVEPKTQADPELKSSRRYTNLSAAEVRKALLEEKGYRDEDVPAERTLRDILNRMNYRLKRIQKGRPLKKTKETDAIFENVVAVKAASRGDPETLEISADTEAKVAALITVSATERRVIGGCTLP